MGVFGPIIGERQIRNAVLGLLQNPPSSQAGVVAPRLVYYLAEVERQEGLRPRTLDVPRIYRGGTDFNVWQGDESPTIVVVVKPTGAPTKPEMGMYGQVFEIQAAAIVKADDEESARTYANCYGNALMAAISQNGTLGPNPSDASTPLASGTMLTASPVTTFAASSNESRGILRSTVTFESLVIPTVLAWSAPATWPTDPYTTSDGPTVEQVGVTVGTVSPSGVPSQPAGGQVVVSVDEEYPSESEFPSDSDDPSDETGEVVVND